MASQIDICNAALINAGQSTTIAAMNESSTAATVLSTLWAMSRDKVTRDNPWRFARRWGTLQQLPASPTTDWLYAYALPSDCLIPRRIGNNISRVESQPIPWTTANNGSQNILLTDQAGAVLEYTARVEDATQFPADFAAALALYLGAQICPALNVKYDVRAGLMAEYRKEISNAAANSANQNAPDIPAPCEFLAVRNPAFTAASPVWPYGPYS